MELQISQALIPLPSVGSLHRDKHWGGTGLAPLGFCCPCANTQGAAPAARSSPVLLSHPRRQAQCSSAEPHRAAWHREAQREGEGGEEGKGKIGEIKLGLHSTGVLTPPSSGAVRVTGS